MTDSPQNTPSSTSNDVACATGRFFGWRFIDLVQPPWRLSTWWPSDTSAAFHESLARLLAVAHRERLSLAPLVKNFADEHRGIRKSRLQRLAKQLESGIPLVDGLEQVPGLLPAGDVLALRFATQTGTLLMAYGFLTRTPSAQELAVTASLRRSIEHAIAMIVAFLAIAVYMCVSSLPKFQMMANDFGFELPVAIEVQIYLFSQMVGAGFLWLCVGAGLAGLVLVAPLRRFVRRVFGSLANSIGIASRSAEILRLVSFTSETGRPIASALSSLARFHYEKGMRRKLLYVRNEIEQGSDVWDCLVREKIINRPEADAIRNAPSSPVQAWTLRQLADAKDFRVSGRLQQIAAIVPILIVLFGAAFVLWISLGIIHFMLRLI